MATPPLPPLEAQKRWIVDNMHAFTRDALVHIARVITTAYEDDVNQSGGRVVIENPRTKRLSFNIDNIDQPLVVAQVFRTGKSCIDSLNRPAD